MRLSNLFRLLASWIGLTCVVQPQAARAYSVPEHEQLTRSAFQAILPCLKSQEATLPEASQKEVMRFNAWEDHNLANKWFRFSHFYHPQHEESGSGLFRENSRARVLQLTQRLQGGQHTHRWLGYLIHHIQDMTLPMHVLMVNHFWTDGLEKFKAPHPEKLAFESCDALIQAALQTTPDQLHQSTAEETLQATLSGYLTASAPSHYKIPLVWFWMQGSNGRFGNYGLLGNAFGMRWVSALGQGFEISQHEYARYKSTRLAAAERATQMLLARAWLLDYFVATH